MSEWFIINNIEDFTDKARSIVYNNFGAWSDKDEDNIIVEEVKDLELEEFNKVLSHQESLVIVKNIAKKQKNRKTNKVRYILDENLFASILQDLNLRMVSNIINNLSQKGLIESAFDSEINDFVFWVKDDEEIPETD